MGEFSKRLGDCIRRTDMTTSDLARWFDRPRATVNTWVNGRTPFGPAAKKANQRLEMLELSIRTRPEYYPVPPEQNWTDRERYVRGMYDDAKRHFGVSAMRAAG